MDLYFRLLLLPVIFEVVMETGCDCNGTDIHINATTDPQVIRSPDFPLSYANNVSFKVLVEAPTYAHVLHVHIVYMQLNNWNSTCGDRLVAYDGNSSDASELHTWCGADKMATSTSGDSLFLVFETDDFLTDSGFVLRFWEDVSTTCRPGNSIHLNITDTPVLLTIPRIPLHDEQRCVYHLRTTGDRRISLTLKNWGDTSPRGCNNTHLQMYEDTPTTSQLTISWRHPIPPFSRVITTSTSLTINFTATTPSVTNTTTPTTMSLPLCKFTLIATSISNNVGDDTADVVEVTSSPTYIWYSGHIQGQVKLVSRDFTKTVRLDVIDAGCNPNCFYVTQDNPNGKQLEGTFTDNTTTYRSTGPVIFISNFTDQSEDKLLLRVTSLDRACNGGVKKVKATTDAAVTSMLDMAACKYNGYYIYNITTDHADHIVNLKLSRNFFNATSPDKECNHSYINIYDGNPHCRLLRKWCWKQTPSIAVTGDKSYLTFVVATSHGDFPGPLTVTHFALLSASKCKPGLVDLKASADVTKYLSSPNFPGPYSVNNDCTWRISAPRINYVVLINVVKSDLPNDCSDLVYIIYGLYPTEKTSGRLCGQDRGHFRSVGPFLILRFTSNSFDNRSGFKIAYSTEHNTGGQRTEGGPPVGFVPGACITIFTHPYTCVS
ncbi:cubilin-like isoform X2 [Haliotis rubra]|uniref:cubilin-like isoform X2 n=1 Tax=Haliotis rubra TaxID=36100 RepID=UPI001EE52A33|nr:cubilin-like isoform X2 [Haliotis rubra]